MEDKGKRRENERWGEKRVKRCREGKEEKLGDGHEK